MEKRSIHVEQLRNIAIKDLNVEIVERKGKGHPDSLIDGASESVSRALCEYYDQKYGVILHHNVDKGLLVGGQSNPKFGGGDIIEPIYVIVAGRVTNFVVNDNKIEPVPVGRLVISSIKKFFKSSMRFLDSEKHLIVDYRMKQGSADLAHIFKKSLKIPLSNDTSVGVGFSPLTPTERLVLETEKLLNSEKLKKEIPEVGEDIKVMGLRRGKEIDLTIAAAMVSGLIPDRNHYINVIEDVGKRIEDFSSKITDMGVKLKINPADDYEKGVFYLTVTGTSAESGDDGNTGRGNRLNGLITPMRPCSMEASAGKNPINHTGKLFNVLAQRITDKIYDEVKGIKEVYLHMLSCIGKPIDQPKMARVSVVLEQGTTLSSIERDIESITDEQISKVTTLTPLILSDSLPFYL
ncbi:MAG: methionine adenosyltransferase [Candidatus Methylarchaceae archaeon HK02M1]|nr:methionine adenosyltransferase [Candidatus Methylarchaceae archaeon HK02M1]